MRAEGRRNRKCVQSLAGEPGRGPVVVEADRIERVQDGAAPIGADRLDGECGVGRGFSLASYHVHIEPTRFQVDGGDADAEHLRTAHDRARARPVSNPSASFDAELERHHHLAVSPVHSARTPGEAHTTHPVRPVGCILAPEFVDVFQAEGAERVRNCVPRNAALLQGFVIDLDEPKTAIAIALDEVVVCGLRERLQIHQRDQTGMAGIDDCGYPVG